VIFVAGLALLFALAEGGVPWIPLLTFALPGIGQLIVVTIVITKMHSRQNTDHEELTLLRRRFHRQRSQITALLIHAKLEDMIVEDE
jgi:hypothetical protein